MLVSAHLPSDPRTRHSRSSFQLLGDPAAVVACQSRLTGDTEQGRGLTQQNAPRLSPNSRLALWPLRVISDHYLSTPVDVRELGMADTHAGTENPSPSPGVPQKTRQSIYRLKGPQGTKRRNIIRSGLRRRTPSQGSDSPVTFCTLSPSFCLLPGSAVDAQHGHLTRVSPLAFLTSAFPHFIYLLLAWLSNAEIAHIAASSTLSEYFLINPFSPGTSILGKRRLLHAFVH